MGTGCNLDPPAAGHPAVGDSQLATRGPSMSFMVSRADVEGALRTSGDDTIIEVWVVPGARRTEVTGLHDGALRVRVAAPAEHGKANRALLQLVEHVLGAGAQLERGTLSRRKQVRVAGQASSEVAGALVEHLAGRR